MRLTGNSTKDGNIKIWTTILIVAVVCMAAVLYFQVTEYLLYDEHLFARPEPNGVLTPDPAIPDLPAIEAEQPEPGEIEEEPETPPEDVDAVEPPTDEIPEPEPETPPEDTVSEEPTDELLTEDTEETDDEEENDG